LGLAIIKFDGFDDFHVLPAGVVHKSSRAVAEVDTMFQTLKTQYDCVWIQPCKFIDR
jgi:hypothetical protein